MGSRSKSERLPRAELAIQAEASHETLGEGGASTEPPDGGRVYASARAADRGARNGQAFGLSQTLDKPG